MTLKEMISSAIVLAIVFVLAGAWVWSRESARPGQKPVIVAQHELEKARHDLAAVQGLAELPPMEQDWTKFNDMAAACGLKVHPQAKLGTDISYTGNSAAWSAAVTGNAMSVFSCVSEMQQSIPVVLDGIMVGDDTESNARVATLLVSVLGHV